MGISKGVQPGHGWSQVLPGHIYQSWQLCPFKHAGFPIVVGAGKSSVQNPHVVVPPLLELNDDEEELEPLEEPPELEPPPLSELLLCAKR
jgi:hypothetical protein